MSTAFVSRWSLRKKTANTPGGGTAKTDRTPSGALFCANEGGWVTDRTAKTPTAACGTSPDVRLTQPCPNPACMSVIIQANTFVHEQLAGRLAADYTPLFASAAYQANPEALIVALQTGDLETTKAVCRAWCKLVMGWTQAQHRAEAEARRRDAVLV